MRGPLATYELGRAAATAAVSSHLGPWQASARAVADRERPGDADRTFMESYDPTLIGFGETFKYRASRLILS